MHGRIIPARFAFVAALLIAGCADGLTPEKTPSADANTEAVVGAAFDEAATGTLVGTVRWQGELPQVAPFNVFGLPGNYPVDVRQDQPNPNLPRIQPTTLAMEDVVVFLRNVDLKKSRPWDHPKVRVEQRDRHIHICQGSASGNVGWVRAGEAIEVNNLDNHFHMLRGRGAAFFSLPFAASKTPSYRRLDKPGTVELSSGSFFFWMRGYLLVDDHPYYARTDARGRFILEKVPAGTYDLVCWMPNWNVAKRNRDPETGLIIQVDFHAPVEQARKVVVTTGQERETSFTWSARDFEKQ